MTSASSRDYSVVYRVYHSIIDAPWFEHTEPNENACAKLVLEVYGLGCVREDEFRQRCQEAAKWRFARSH